MSDVELSHAALGDWLQRYGKAWEEKDPDAAGSLFTADARYYETPWSDPFEGPAGVSEYWARVTTDQTDIDFKYSVIATESNTGIASWSARCTTISEGAKIELNGVFVLEFVDNHRCAVLREWWHLRQV